MPSWRPASRNVHGAAVLLAAVLFVQASLTPSRDAAAGTAARDAAFCAEPGEREALRGWTSDVSCRDDSRAHAPLRGPARLLFGLTLDVNRADTGSLQVLPRIGPRRAAAIVAARREAPFPALADLERIEGIGPATIAGLVGLAHAGPGSDHERTR